MHARAITDGWSPSLLSEVVVTDSGPGPRTPPPPAQATPPLAASGGRASPGRAYASRKSPTRLHGGVRSSCKMPVRRTEAIPGAANTPIRRIEPIPGVAIASLRCIGAIPTCAANTNCNARRRLQALRSPPVRAWWRLQAPRTRLARPEGALSGRCDRLHARRGRGFSREIRVSRRQEAGMRAWSAASGEQSSSSRRA